MKYVKNWLDIRLKDAQNMIPKRGEPSAVGFAIIPAFGPDAHAGLAVQWEETQEHWGLTELRGHGTDVMEVRADGIF